MQTIINVYNNDISQIVYVIQYHFLYRAALSQITGDFPAYAMLSDWSMKGLTACTYCQDEIVSKSFRIYGVFVIWDMGLFIS